MLYFHNYPPGAVCAPCQCEAVSDPASPQSQSASLQARMTLLQVFFLGGEKHCQVRRASIERNPLRDAA